MDERQLMLIRLKQVEAGGRFKHRDTGLIVRTPGLEPDACMKLIDQYAKDYAICELEKIKAHYVNDDQAASSGGRGEEGVRVLHLITKSIHGTVDQAINRLRGGQEEGK